jgi:hypothetical protein
MNLPAGEESPIPPVHTPAPSLKRFLSYIFREIIRQRKWLLLPLWLLLALIGVLLVLSGNAQLLPVIYLAF